MRSELYIDEIYGVLTLPEDKNCPLVILVHGYEGSHKDNLNYADAFMKEGIGSYTFDFSTGSEGIRSKKNERYSVSSEIEQLKKVIDYFRDYKSLYLMGESLGGLVSALCADEKIKGMMMLYPAFSLRDSAHRVFPTRKEIKDTIWLDAWVGKEFFEAIYDLDIFKEISKYTGKVEIYHGDKDSIVPIKYSYDALDVYKDANLIVFEGEEHNWYSPLSDKAAMLMVDFVKRCETCR
ncbi:MAG: alpha/beta hydrolase [Erysipelotrichaceae bacterium]|nr:alpha/beta hydrolase [Erysipelotrichaceae bacterium]